MVKEGYLWPRDSLVGAKSSLLAGRRGDDGGRRLLLEEKLGFLVRDGE